MRILLDSHTLIWALHAPDRLRPEARLILEDPRTIVFFSAASVWELEMKRAKGKLDLPEDWLDAISHLSFLHLAITADDAVCCAHLPPHHADPFDRMLIAQATMHQLTLASRDAMLSGYGVNLLLV